MAESTKALPLVQPRCGTSCCRTQLVEANPSQSSLVNRNLREEPGVLPLSFYIILTRYLLLKRTLNNMYLARRQVLRLLKHKTLCTNPT